MFLDERLPNVYDGLNSCITNPQYASIEGYLDNLSHQTQNIAVTQPKPLKAKFLEHVWSGQVRKVRISPAHNFNPHAVEI